jgi:hypothetical protein
MAADVMRRQGDHDVHDTEAGQDDGAGGQGTDHMSPVGDAEQQDDEEQGGTHDDLQDRFARRVLSRI